MPDRQILEAMVENQLTDLIEQSKDVTKFTHLEAKLIPVIVERIREFSNPEERQKRVNHYDTELGNYVDLLECCYTAKRQGTKGYCPLNANVPNDVIYATLNDEKLRDIARLDLIERTNTKLRKSIVLEEWSGDKLVSSSSLEKQKFWHVYQITYKGMQLLQEHKKIKSDECDANAKRI